MLTSVIITCHREMAPPSLRLYRHYYIDSSCPSPDVTVLAQLAWPHHFSSQCESMIAYFKHNHSNGYYFVYYIYQWYTLLYVIKRKFYL